jgi:hypothetical protein
MHAGLFARGDDRTHDIARLKAPDMLGCLGASAREAALVHTAHLA